jgi:hypothetical protein
LNPIPPGGMVVVMRFPAAAQQTQAAETDHMKETLDD